MTARWQQPLELLAAWLLCVAAVTAPLVAGCTGEWPRFVLESVCCLAVMAWAVSNRRPMAALLVPLALAGLMLLQITPLPDRVLVGIAPVSAGAWKVAHTGISRAWGSVSIEPGATAAGIRRLLLGLATVGVVADLAKAARYARWLSIALGVSACLIVTLGVVFAGDDSRVLLNLVDLKGPIETEFWKSPLIAPLQSAGYGEPAVTTVGDQVYTTYVPVAGDIFGSYISSNQFAAGVYLTLPTALCLWLTFMKGLLPGWLRYVGFLAGFAAAIWLVGRMADSRAGGAAMALAATVACAGAAPTRSTRRAATGLALAVATGVLLFTLAFHHVLPGFDSLLPLDWQRWLAHARGDGRVIASQAALRMFRASPLVGTGLGTFEDLFLTMRPPIMRDIWYYAHNDYAQLLAETGVIGFGAFALGTSLVVWRVARYLRGASDADRLLVMGPVASLAALAVQSAFDWNMHVPANGFLATLLVGLILGMSCARPVPASPAIKSSLLGAVSTAAVIVACAACLPYSFRDARSEAAQRSLRRALVDDTIAAQATSKELGSGNPAALLTATDLATRAAASDPHNARLAVLLGHAELRLAAGARRTVPPTAAAAAAADRHGAQAAEWFKKARLRCAMCGGIPNPVPPRPTSR